MLPKIAKRFLGVYFRRIAEKHYRNSMNIGIIGTGEARTKWLHGIAARLTDPIAGDRRKRGRRVSITFRTAKNPDAVPEHWKQLQVERGWNARPEQSQKSVN